ncbi:MAG TPA: histone H1-like repetitive region-containing protein, partial [Actinomycetota bacterium]
MADDQGSPKRTTGKKVPAKKTAAKRTTAKSATAKSATAKKTVAKKTTAVKRSAAKKTTVKSTTAKRTAARKPAARRAIATEPVSMRAAPPSSPPKVPAAPPPAPAAAVEAPPLAVGPEPAQPSLPRRRRRTAGIVAAIVAGAAALGGGGYALLSGDTERGSPEESVRGYYRALEADDCRLAATFVDPAFATQQRLCEQFDDIRRASGTLSDVLSVDVRDDRATMRIVRVVAGVSEERLVGARSVEEGWLLTGGKSCYDVQRPEDLGNDHLEEGEVFSGYSSNPPTSGPHDAIATEPGVIYQEPQPVERL